ncbi:MAG: hypothetical protein Rhirs2KO_18610 [Rhizobiaceae bacterium]
MQSRREGWVVRLLRWLGVTPTGSKTGKREAAWTVFAVTLMLHFWMIAVGIWWGIEYITALLPLQMALWAYAGALLAAAYGLEQVKDLFPRRGNDFGQDIPDGYPKNVVAPGEPYIPEDTR